MEQMRLSADPIHLSAKQRGELEALTRKSTAEQRLVTRAQIILLADQGVGVRETAARLGVARRMVQDWRRRWRQADASATPSQRLSDAPRSGCPPTFTPEQICQIVAIACEDPQESGRPISHWTYAEIANEAAVRRVVECISLHSVGRFLRELDLKPHQTRGWLNTERNADFPAQCHDICETYHQAAARAAAGIETRCIDEKPGIQALERIAPNMCGLSLLMRNLVDVHFPSATCIQVALDNLNTPCIGFTLQGIPGTRG